MFTNWRLDFNRQTSPQVKEEHKKKMNKHFKSFEEGTREALEICICAIHSGRFAFITAFARVSQA